MTTEGKVWGTTELIHRSESVTVHLLRIREGGFSSEHRHAIKKNVFAVLKGRLVIRIWREAPKVKDGENYFTAARDLVDDVILGPGGSTEIEPGVWHQFIAKEETEAIEIYVAMIQDPDIERRTQGDVILPGIAK